MSRAKKVIRIALIVIAVLVVVAYVGGNVVLNKASRKMLDKVAARGERYGVQIQQPDFDKARISGIKSATWFWPTATLQLEDNNAFNPGRVFHVRVDRLDVWLVGGGRVAIAAENLEIDSTLPTGAAHEPTEGDVDTSRERFTADSIQTELDLNVFDPLPGIEEALPKVFELATSGQTTLPLDFSGTLSFFVKGEEIKAGCHVEKQGDNRALILEAEDLRPISDLYDEPLTEAEIEVIAGHPLQTPRLLRIKEDAENSASEAHQQDDTVPEDAYRHVLWSYLLTQTFGEELAEEVTNAHEEGDTGNTPAERSMDLSNNESGRRFAREGLRRAELLDRVRTDPAILRQPE